MRAAIELNSFLDDIPVVKAAGIRAEYAVMGVDSLPNYFVMKK